MSEKLTRAFFAGLLDSTFELEQPLASPPLRLVSVEGLSGDPESDESFSLLFSGPKYLPQAIYKLHHEKAGELDIFLVPIQGDPRGFVYQAVYNRMQIRNQK